MFIDDDDNDDDQWGPLGCVLLNSIYVFVWLFVCVFCLMCLLPSITTRTNNQNKIRRTKSMTCAAYVAVLHEHPHDRKHGESAVSQF